MSSSNSNQPIHLALLAAIAGSFAVNGVHLYYRVLQLVTNPDYPGTQHPDNYPQYVIWIGFGASLVVQLLSALWSYRIYLKLYRYDLHLKYTPQQTVGAWLIPVRNLYRPLFVVRESWEEMHLLTGRSIMEVNRGIIGVWWVLRVTGTLFLLGFFYFYKPSAGENTIPLAVILITLDLLLSTLSLPLYAYIVVRMMRLEKKLSRKSRSR